MVLNDYPKITIVTSCFNHGKFVGETIDSVVSQNYPNLEYIVINDGSTDNSEEEILKYKKFISRYEYYEGHRNSPIWAINKAFNYATGEIYGWINSDDILLKNSLFTAAKVFSELKEVDWFTGLASTINSRGELVNAQLRPKHRLDFLVDNWKIIQQESTFFRKTLWHKTGSKLNEEYLWSFDTELWTRFFLYAKHYNLNAPIGAFRKGPQSKTIRSINDFLNGSKIAINKFKENSNEEKYINLYSFLRTKYIKQILSIVPMKLLKKILHENFFYDKIYYSFREDKFLIKKENPFKY